MLIDPCIGELWETIDRDGFAVVPDVIEAATVAKLIAAMATTFPSSRAVPRRGSVYGGRNLLREIPEVRALANSGPVRRLAEKVIGPSAFAVRALLFDKNSGANWSVDWHQDRTIAVRERLDMPGFELWTVKAGVPHVQPPQEILERMLAFRIHLDDCHEDNGPLRVMHGSHRAGFLDADQIDEWAQSHEAVACVVPEGGVLVMRPLLLHASARAKRPEHRRVIHLEFAAEALPRPLEWNERS